MQDSPPWIEFQSGVLPYRRTAEGVAYLLVTSRNRGRWVIPKGSLEPDLSALESARKEAYEEAGVRGRIRPDPLGRYLHQRLGIPSLVQVFLMEVTECLDGWPEQAWRERRWMPVPEAQASVPEEGLRRLMAQAEAWILDRS